MQPARKLRRRRICQRRRLRYASDCSGYDGCALALKYLGQLFIHVFASELDDRYACVFRSAHPDCQTLYRDVTTRCCSKLKQVHGGLDLYVAGFPCQPWSNIGKKLGALDAEGRGLVGYHILMTIQALLPSAFILENVAGLCSASNGEFFIEMLEFLIGLGCYEVHW